MALWSQLLAIVACTVFGVLSAERLETFNLDWADLMLEPISSVVEASHRLALVKRSRNVNRGLANSTADPVFTVANPKHKTVLKKLWEVSMQWAQVAARNCRGADWLVLAWFGNDDAATMDKVCGHMLQIVNVLDKLHLKDDTNWCTNKQGKGDGTLMYVRTAKDVRKDSSGHHEIHVCPSFWDLLGFDAKDTAKYGTLVHEASHHFDTKDEKLGGLAAYGAARSFALARASTTQAVNNADNYKWFAYYMKKYGKVQPPVLEADGPCIGKVKKFGQKMTTLAIWAQCTEGVQPTEVTGMFLDKGNPPKLLNLPEVEEDPQPNGKNFSVETTKKANAGGVQLWYEAGGTFFQGSAKLPAETFQTKRIDLTPTPPDVMPCRLEFHTTVGTDKFKRTTFPTKLIAVCSDPVKPLLLERDSYRPTPSLKDKQDVTSQGEELMSGDYFTDFAGRTYTFKGVIGGRTLTLTQKVPNALESCELDTHSPVAVHTMQADINCKLTVSEVTFKLGSCRGGSGPCSKNGKETSLVDGITKGEWATLASFSSQKRCSVKVWGFVDGVFGYVDSGCR